MLLIVWDTFTLYSMLNEMAIQMSDLHGQCQFFIS